MSASLDLPRRPMLRRPSVLFQGLSARRLGGVILALTLIGCRTAMESDRSVRDVLAAVREHGQAAVMIALVSPAAASDPARAHETRAEIARMQDDVIAALDPSDFRVGARYTSVAALAGVLFSERGLQRVRAHPFVLRVSLDTGGSGHR